VRAIASLRWLFQALGGWLRVLLALMFLILLGVWLIPQGLFELGTVSDRGETTLVRSNRITGKATYFRAADAHPFIFEAEPTPLPYGELAKVTGRASYSDFGRTFSGRLYNGSNWRLTSATFDIELKDPRKKTLWKRQYRTSLNILPLTADDFSFAILEGFQLIEAGESRWSWTLEEAKGME